MVIFGSKHSWHKRDKGAKCFADIISHMNLAIWDSEWRNALSYNLGIYIYLQYSDISVILMAC